MMITRKHPPKKTEGRSEQQKRKRKEKEKIDVTTLVVNLKEKNNTPSEQKNNYY